MSQDTLGDILKRYYRPDDSDDNIENVLWACGLTVKNRIRQSLRLNGIGVYDSIDQLQFAREHIVLVHTKEQQIELEVYNYRLQSTLSRNNELNTLQCNNYTDDTNKEQVAVQSIFAQYKRINDKDVEDVYSQFLVGSNQNSGKYQKYVRPLIPKLFMLGASTMMYYNHVEPHSALEFLAPIGNTIMMGPGISYLRRTSEMKQDLSRRIDTFVQKQNNFKNAQPNQVILERYGARKLSQQGATKYQTNLGQILQFFYAIPGVVDAIGVNWNQIIVGLNITCDHNNSLSWAFSMIPMSTYDLPLGTYIFQHQETKKSTYDDDDDVHCINKQIGDNDQLKWSEIEKNCHEVDIQSSEKAGVYNKNFVRIVRAYLHWIDIPESATNILHIKNIFERETKAPILLTQLYGYNLVYIMSNLQRKTDNPIIKGGGFTLSERELNAFKQKLEAMRNENDDDSSTQDDTTPTIDDNASDQDGAKTPPRGADESSDQDDATRTTGTPTCLAKVLYTFGNAGKNWDKCVVNARNMLIPLGINAVKFIMLCAIGLFLAQLSPMGQTEEISNGEPDAVDTPPWNSHNTTPWDRTLDENFRQCKLELGILEDNLEREKQTNENQTFQLTNQTNFVNGLNSKLATCMASVDALQTLAENINETNCPQELMKCTADFANADGNRRALEDANLKLSKNLEKQTSTNQKLIKINEELDKKVESLTTKKNELTSNLNATKTKLESAQESLQALTTQLENTPKPEEHARIRGELNTIQKQVQDLETNISTIKQELNQKTAELTDANRQLNTLKTTYDVTTCTNSADQIQRTLDQTVYKLTSSKKTKLRPAIQFDPNKAIDAMTQVEIKSRFGTPIRPFNSAQLEITSTTPIYVNKNLKKFSQFFGFMHFLESLIDQTEHDDIIKSMLDACDASKLIVVYGTAAQEKSYRQNLDTYTKTNYKGITSQGLLPLKEFNASAFALGDQVDIPYTSQLDQDSPKWNSFILPETYFVYTMLDDDHFWDAGVNLLTSRVTSSTSLQRVKDSLYASFPYINLEQEDQGTFFGNLSRKLVDYNAKCLTVKYACQDCDTSKDLVEFFTLETNFNLFTETWCNMTKVTTSMAEPKVKGGGLWGMVKRGALLAMTIVAQVGVSQVDARRSAGTLDESVDASQHLAHYNNTLETLKQVQSFCPDVVETVIKSVEEAKYYASQLSHIIEDPEFQDAYADTTFDAIQKTLKECEAEARRNPDIVVPENVRFTLEEAPPPPTINVTKFLNADKKLDIDGFSAMIDESPFNVTNTKSVTNAVDEVLTMINRMNDEFQSDHKEDIEKLQSINTRCVEQIHGYEQLYPPDMSFPAENNVERHVTKTFEINFMCIQELVCLQNVTLALRNEAILQIKKEVEHAKANKLKESENIYKNQKIKENPEDFTNYDQAIQNATQCISALNDTLTNLTNLTYLPYLDIQDLVEDCMVPVHDILGTLPDKDGVVTQIINMVKGISDLTKNGLSFTWLSDLIEVLAPDTLGLIFFIFNLLVDRELRDAFVEYKGRIIIQKMCLKIGALVVPYLYQSITTSTNITASFSEVMYGLISNTFLERFISVSNQTTKHAQTVLPYWTPYYLDNTDRGSLMIGLIGGIVSSVYDPFEVMQTTVRKLFGPTRDQWFNTSNSLKDNSMRAYCDLYSINDLNTVIKIGFDPPVNKCYLDLNEHSLENAIANSDTYVAFQSIKDTTKTITIPLILKIPKDDTTTHVFPMLHSWYNEGGNIMAIYKTTFTELKEIKSKHDAKTIILNRFPSINLKNQTLLNFTTGTTPDIILNCMEDDSQLIFPQINDVRNYFNSIQKTYLFKEIIPLDTLNDPPKHVEQSFRRTPSNSDLTRNRLNQQTSKTPEYKHGFHHPNTTLSPLDEDIEHTTKKDSSFVTSPTVPAPAPAPAPQNSVHATQVRPTSAPTETPSHKELENKRRAIHTIIKWFEQKQQDQSGGKRKTENMSTPSDKSIHECIGYFNNLGITNIEKIERLIKAALTQHFANDTSSLSSIYRDKRQLKVIDKILEILYPKKEGIGKTVRRQKS